MSVFDLHKQNTDLDKKIVAGLERLSQVFRTLLWEQAKEHGLSPIQVQLLIFIQHHSPELSTVSYLAREFNVTKPTISDAIKALEQKELIKKNPDNNDTRSYSIQLTSRGKKVVTTTEQYTDPLTKIVNDQNRPDKLILWENITSLILELNRQGIISVQRTCFNCIYHSTKNKDHFCSLLGKKLLSQDIRIDCREFEPA